MATAGLASAMTGGFPPPFVTLAITPKRERIVSVLIKRTYAVRAGGVCGVSERQLPLDSREVPVAEQQSWAAELDVVPYKMATDFLVFGRAYAAGGRCAVMDVCLEVPQVRKCIRVFGDRRCSYRGSGAPAFSAPAPFDVMPLEYTRAYGGVDRDVAYPASPTDIADFLAQLTRFPGVYPRNPSGKGYVVYAKRGYVDGLELPNLEDPEDLLRPDRLIVGRPEDWHRQPLPQAFGWFDISWFPRCVYAGASPVFAPPEMVREVALGYLPRDYAERLRTGTPADMIDFRLLNGASPGLVLPYLRGDEMVKISGMSPNGDIVFRLPGHRPVVSIGLNGKPLSVELVPHTVGVLTDERVVYIVWRASAKTPSGYRERLPTRENLKPDLLEEFQIGVV
jgi:hypothetical protein